MSPNLDSVIYQNQYSLSYNTLANSSKYHFYYFVPLLSHAFLLSLPTLHSSLLLFFSTHLNAPHLHLCHDVKP